MAQLDNRLDEKCEFPPTEINHDLNPPLLNRITIAHNFKDIYKTALGICNDNAKYTDGFRLKDDYSMVQYIFGRTLETIKADISLRNGQTINVDVKTSRGPDRCNIIGFNKPYNNNLFNLFLNEDG